MKIRLVLDLIHILLISSSIVSKVIKFEDVERNGADSEQRDPAEDAQVDFRWRQGWGRKNHLQVENYLFSFFFMKKSGFLC